jgi:hypothetical protein
MAVFRAFKPEAMNKIAKAMGYTGNMGQFQDFIEQDPARQARMEQFRNAAVQMAKGGVVQLATGGDLQKQIADAQKRVDATRNINYRGSTINIAGGPTMQGEENYQGYFDSGGRFRKFGQHPDVLAADKAYRSATANLANLQKQYADMQKKAASQPQKPVGSPQLVDPREGQPQSNNLFNVAPAVVVYDPNTGQQYGSPQQAMQAGVSNPVMSLPPGVSPTFGQQLGGRPNSIPLSDIPPSGQEGQPLQLQQATTPTAQTTAPTSIGNAAMQRMNNPALPQGGVTQAAMTPTGPGQEVQQGTGALTGAVAVPTAMAVTAQATAAQEKDAAQIVAAQAAPAVDAAMNATQAAQGTVDPRAEVTAAQQTASSVGNVTAAQGNAILIDNPVQRQIQQGELISGAVADAQTAAQFTEQVQAAQATPSKQATVQGQLAQLTANFDASNPPAWAAGALRAANAEMIARGLGSSSIAAQAIVQATMESALPIAQADAATIAQFEAQNLSNRQQRVMLAAQQRATFLGQEFDQEFQARVQNAARISDVANQNFTAEQQIQLENSRSANTVNLNNLSNRQALLMSEAASLAQLDQSNLNNRQQAAVQNAQAFLNMDMANLSNQQQTELFRAQQRTQALFTDQSATNAARQFNATSQNQVDQFFANLSSQVSQFNATQANAQAQFNAGQANTVERFNAEMNNQRDQFNAQNQLVIAQSNAQWRRQIATADTAAVNRANEINASALLDISNTAYNNLWQYYADSMEYAWEAADNELDRLNNLAVAQLSADATTKAQEMASSSAAGSALGGLIGTLGSAYIQFGL